MSADFNHQIDDSNATQQQFLTLFLRSEREIFRYVLALVPNASDADDIVQQTALALWEKFDAYDPSQPFTPWACRFALNKVRQWVDRRKKWKALLDNGLTEELELRRQERGPQLESQLRRLENCLKRLSLVQRELIEGYYYRREPIERLAEQSGRTVDASYKMLQRIRHTLQLCIERVDGQKGVVT